MKARSAWRWVVRAMVAGIALALVALAVGYWRSGNDCAAVLAATPDHAMKAYVYCDYGAPDVLRLADVAAPMPGDGQVLVAVRAAGLNQLEAHYLHGTPYVMRLDTGLRKPKNIRIGADLAGVVTAVGPRVTLLRPGDEVFGARNGALAEQVVVAETSVVRKPTNLTFEQAAAVPVAAVTALQAVRDQGRVQRGQSVLVNGASGGVGTFVVQIATAFGARVTGVSSTRNLDLVRSLGAAVTIDYTQQDYTQGTPPYDVIIDMVGNHTLRENQRVLAPSGIYVMVGGPEGQWIAPLDRALQMIVFSKFVSQTFGLFLANVTSAELATLRDLMQAGTVTPVIDRRYPFAELPEAMRYLETGRARGKVVVTVSE